jgi:xyloglucan-specific exo-beta-1,4-glucanase
MTGLLKRIGTFFRGLVVMSVSARAAEPYVWKNVKVLAGGYVPGIVFSRVEKGLAFCRTDIGGCYRWDDAAKVWLPMTDFISEPNYFGGESIAPDPVDANVVYMAAGMYSPDPAAMMRSHDKGKTWEVFPVSFRMGGNEDGRGMGERLAVDPSDTRVLYFASRYEGLCKSSDSAATWEKVKSFPIAGLGNPEPEGGRRHAGLSVVVFDPRGAARGTPSKTIFVGSGDPGEEHLFRSDDSGETWKAVAGQPLKLLVAQAQMDDEGVLYIAYGNNIGPNGVTDGAVWKLDTRSNQWTDITPEPGPTKGKGGYFGLSLDRQHTGTLAVATMNHWSPIDTVWRTTDGGKSWKDIAAKSVRDVSVSPYLHWGKPEAKLGWWMSALAIDPFNSDHVAYGTGATIFASDDFTNVSKDQATHWYPWVAGIEETAVITLISPPEGAHLLSGFGDIGGFRHDDFDASPAKGMYENPQFGTTVTMDYAGAKPAVIVRAGRGNDGAAPLGYSEDGGVSWQPMALPGSRGRGDTPAMIVSADGETFVVMTSPVKFTRDRGKTWTAVKGLPSGGRPVADQMDGQKFYSIDFKSSTIYASDDGGATFASAGTVGLPSDIKGDRPSWSEAPWPLVATFGRSGDLWFVSSAGLFHSVDGGKHFAKAESNLHVEKLALGKAPQGKEYPALFAIGIREQTLGVWRSDDQGTSWVRVTDDQHEYGRRYRCIAADPRVFGRVYIGTDGRGLFYGEPVGTAQ